MKRLLFTLWQWTWGLPQNLLGVLLCFHHRNCPRSRYRSCTVVHWNQRGSMGLGCFLFMGSDNPEVFVHEFGHSIQSMILGPLFLPVMGIPSFLWCNLPVFRRLRREKGISYYAFYPESTANSLGMLVTGEPCHLR